MPLKARDLLVGGDVYASPFIGPINHTATVRLDVSGLTTDEVDQYGYLKPGLPLSSAGVLVTTGVAVFGVVIESLKIADDNAAATLTAATDIDIAVAVIGQVNRDIIEDNLGRALTADELAGFALAPCTVKLVQ